VTAAPPAVMQACTLTALHLGCHPTADSCRTPGLLLQIILCANTPEECAELRAAGVRCIYFNHNAALDEHIFRITGEGEEACCDMLCGALRCDAVLRCAATASGTLSEAVFTPVRARPLTTCSKQACTTTTDH